MHFSWTSSNLRNCIGRRVFEWKNGFQLIFGNSGSSFTTFFGGCLTNWCFFMQLSTNALKSRFFSYFFLKGQDRKTRQCGGSCRPPTFRFHFAHQWSNSFSPRTQGRGTADQQFGICASVGYRAVSFLLGWVLFCKKGHQTSLHSRIMFFERNSKGIKPVFLLASIEISFSKLIREG